MPKQQIDPGHRFGHLVVLRELEPHHPGYKRRFLCRCDCGAEVSRWLQSIRNGKTDSCGCESLKRTARSRGHDLHGQSYTSTYYIWRNMVHRCTNPKDKRWHDYGGRGITVCERWLKFTNFYADMGDRPPGLTLDRIDNDMGYSPENCRWITPKEQQVTARRERKIVTANGRTMSLQDWAKELGIKRTTLAQRLRTMASPEAAINYQSRKLMSEG